MVLGNQTPDFHQSKTLASSRRFYGSLSTCPWMLRPLQQLQFGVNPPIITLVHLFTQFAPPFSPHGQTASA